MYLYTFGLLFILLLFPTDSASGIDCYVCNSAQDGCGESVDGALLRYNGYVVSGCASCVKAFSALGTIWSSVTRWCQHTAEDRCTNILGYGKCTCSTTFCNSATITYGYLPATILATLMTVVLF